MSLPAWNDSAHRQDTFGTRWPLGLEAVSQHMVDGLLHGLTGATKHVRYYSFFCWAHWTLMRQTKGTTVTASQQDRWRRRLENAMRAATLEIRPNLLGVVGSSNYRPLPDSDESPYDLDDDNPATAFEPAAYEASWYALRCGDQIASTRHVRLSPGIGVELGAAFHEKLVNLTDSRTVGQFLEGGSTVPAGLVRRLAEGLSLGPVAPEDPEHPLLCDLLFRLERPSDVASVAAVDRDRSLTLSLVLEIVRQAQGTVTGVEDFHRLFSSGYLPTGTPFQAPKELALSYSRWRRYQERQFEQIALYGLWGAVNRLLDVRPHKSWEIAELLKREAAGSELTTRLLGAAGLETEVGNAIQNLGGYGRLDDSIPGTLGDDLVARVRKPEDTGSLVAASLSLLLWTLAVWQKRKTEVDERAWRLHREYGISRLALEAVLRDAEHRSSESLFEYLGWVLESYVVAQSAKIALSRYSRKRNPFFILRTEDGWVQVSPFQESVLGNFQPRLGPAVSLLTELRLLESDQGSLHLTPTGATWLDRSLTVGAPS